MSALRTASLLAVLAIAACGDTTTPLVPDASGKGAGGSNVVDPNAGPPFEAGAIVIPMDLSYQATGMFQAYGLIYQLLRQGVHVYWMIDPAKTWHAAPCNSTTDPCPWDCAVEGSGVKCAYPTASPDVYATTKVVWAEGSVPRGTAIGRVGYRGGPFVIDEADHDKALAIIDIWNDQSKWATNPWAMRSVFHVVAVHEATEGFVGTASRTMIAAPTIAVFADGNEPIATGYLRAAGIPQSNGAEFPSVKCTAATCGPSTANPDMLLEEQIMGDLGTCNAPNLDHKNGALFDANGNPRFCQIMSMHWGVNERETVKCDGGNCPATQGECTGQAFTYNGHEVVAEVREFLKHSTHFFAECQAVNAYENLVPNPAWPFLDDAGRDGHFLTTTGTPPLCPANTCANADYECVQNACGGQACCLPKPATWQNLPGFEVAAQPAASEVKVLRPDVPYNQIDGAFGTTGGSEPAYNLSAYLGTTYKNNRQVTLLTGTNGPGNQDLWMSGYLDGCDDIILGPGPGGVRHASSCGGKISYLGGHQYKTDVPVTSGSQSQGTRLFLNALFEADCVTGADGGGGGFGDSDGDGVGDGADSDPNDPSKCGDTDADGCDDCSTGHLDLVGDCEGPGTPDGGCCETGSGAGGGGALALSGLVLALVMRRRRST